MPLDPIGDRHIGSRTHERVVYTHHVNDRILSIAIDKGDRLSARFPKTGLHVPSEHTFFFERHCRYARIKRSDIANYTRSCITLFFARIVIADEHQLVGKVSRRETALCRLHERMYALASLIAEDDERNIDSSSSFAVHARFFFVDVRPGVERGSTGASTPNVRPKSSSRRTMSFSSKSPYATSTTTPPRFDVRRCTCFLPTRNTSPFLRGIERVPFLSCTIAVASPSTRSHHSSRLL